MISISGVLGLALAPLFSALALAFIAVVFFKALGLAIKKIKASQRSMRIAASNESFEGNIRKITERRRFSDRRLCQEERRHLATA